MASQSILFIKNNNLTHSNRLAEIILKEQARPEPPVFTARQSNNILSKVTYGNPLKATVECTSH